MKKGTIAFCAAISGLIVGGTVNKFLPKEKKGDKEQKFKMYYNMLNQWLFIKQEGKVLEDYFKDNNYKTIAIYGMGEVGERLYEELRNSSIVVKYAIDENYGSIFLDIPVYGLNSDLEQVDAIVVTSIFDYDAIEKQLAEIVSCDILSLNDIVFDI